MNYQRRLVAVLWVVAMLTVGLLLTPVTSIAAGKGASYTFSDCFTYDDGYTYCYSDKGELKATVTPSGNYNFAGNGRASVTVTDPSGSIVYSDSYRYHTHYLDKDGITQEYGNHSRFTYSYGGMTCTGYGAYHFTENRLQFDRYEVSCT